MLSAPDTIKTVVATSNDITDALDHGQTADYKESGILIRLRKFETKSGTKSNLMVTIPSKITGDKPIRKQTKTATEAVNWIESWLKKHTTADASSIEQRAFLSSLPDLRELDVTIPELIRHYKQTYVKPENQMTLKALHQRLMDIIELRDGRDLSSHTQRGNGVYGKRIIADFKDCEAHQITAEGAYQWAMNATTVSKKKKDDDGDDTPAKRWGGKTRSHHWNWLKRLLNLAVSEGAISTNPLDKIGEEKLTAITRKTTKLPEILTKIEAEQLLATVRAEKPQMLGMVVLQLFAGLRTEEARRIKWDDIDFAENTINVSEDVAKTNDIRFVTMNATCKAWLNSCPREGERVNPWSEKSAENRFYNMVKMHLPYKWKGNAMRHSYASYTLVVNDESFTKSQLGHSQNSSTLFKHYRRAATKKAAEDYFKIKAPKTSAKTLSIKSA